MEVRNGIWRRAQNRGTEIREKTVGIIGFGQMGSAFAEKLWGLGCRILVHDKYRNGFGLSYIRECDLSALKEQSDIISIHLPLTAETRGYLNKDFFNSCKQ